VTWRLTVTIRPFRVLRGLALTMLVGTCAATPTVIGDTPLPPRELTAEEIGIQTVDALFAPRMPTLDEKRRLDLATMVVKESVAAKLDPLFVLAVIDAESRFDHEAVSLTGARGLMQVLPGTWKDVVNANDLGHREKFNPAHNAQVGIRYLAFLSKQFRRPDSLLLAYNQGPGGAGWILNGLVEPTEEALAYGPKVMASYSRFLKSAGLDARQARKLWRSPELTVVKVNKPWPCPPTSSMLSAHSRSTGSSSTVLASAKPTKSAARSGSGTRMARRPKLTSSSPATRPTLSRSSRSAHHDIPASTPVIASSSRRCTTTPARYPSEPAEPSSALWTSRQWGLPVRGRSG
jgi:hypothetical protein